VLHLAADFFDDPHRLVPEDVARLEERAHHLVEVQVRPADRSRSDTDDGVGGRLDHRIRHVVDANIALAVPCNCLDA
jgi:hypothetical protein